jgi:hypothetical protein
MTFRMNGGRGSRNVSKSSCILLHHTIQMMTSRLDATIKNTAVQRLNGQLTEGARDNNEWGGGTGMMQKLLHHLVNN